MAALSDPETRRRLDAGAQSDEAGILRHLAVWDRLIIDETFAPENAGTEGQQRGGGGARARRWRPSTPCSTSWWPTACAPACGRPSPSPRRTGCCGREVWQDPRAIVGGSDAGAHLDTMCGAIYSTSLLGDGVRARGLLSWEQAVRLLTDVPARLYGLRDRGRLVVGGFADVVVFDPATIGHGAVRTRDDLPGGASRLYADAVGVGHVLVNGTEIVRDGEFTGAVPGKRAAFGPRHRHGARGVGLGRRAGLTLDRPAAAAVCGQRSRVLERRLAGHRTVPGERVGQLALDLGEGVHQLGAEEDEPGAVLGGVAVGQRAVGDEAVDERAPLLLGVVVRAVGVGEERQRVGDRDQRGAEGVGGAAHVPAQRAGGDPLEHHAGLPALAEHDVEPVQPPQGEQVGRAASPHPDDVLRQQVGADVGHVGHREEGQVRADEAQLGERVVHRPPARVDRRRRRWR